MLRAVTTVIFIPVGLAVVVVGACCASAALFAIISAFLISLAALFFLCRVRVAFSLDVGVGDKIVVDFNLFDQKRVSHRVISCSPGGPNGFPRSA